MKNGLRNVMLGALACVPLLLTGCAPECVDVYDCADKAKADGKEYTCSEGKCVAGSPFPDAGSTGGGGGTTGGGGGTTGGGGGMTGGGGGMTGGGGGMTGGGGGDDGGMTGGGGGATGGGGGATGGGGGDDGGTTGGGGGATGGGGGATGGGGGATGGGGGATGGGGGDDAGTDAGMDDAGMDAGMDDAGTDAGVDAGVDAGTVSEQIAAVRAAIDATTDAGVGQLTIRGAYVSYLKALVPGAGTLSDGGSANDPAGFFIQGSQGGPALFIAIDPTTVAGGLSQGNLIDLTVDTVTKINGVRTVTAISGVVRATTMPDPIPGLIASVTAEDFLASGTIDLFESRLISLNGAVTSESATVGSGYKAVQISTTGTPDGGTNFRLRGPVAEMDALAFGPGCTFTLSGGPLWRFNAAAQPSTFNASELTNIVCPGPALISANATSNTAATVNFSRDLAAATLDAGAFSILASDGGALAVSDATLSSARAVALVTGAQTGGETYTVAVNSSVTDTRGTGATNATATFTGAAGAVCAPGVVISAVFGGNSATAAFNQDFVELHNRTAAPITLTGWSVQYASSTGTSWAVNALTGTIAPGGYHLVGLAVVTGGTSIPTPDSAPTGGSNMSGTNGKIALVAGTTALPAVACPTTGFVDMFGYGTANCFEGTVSPALSTTTTATRNGMACTDTNNNAADFTVGAPVTPKNSASTANTCTCP